MEWKNFTKSIVLYISIGVLYFLFALPFLTVVFPDGYTQVRFTGLLSMAIGLLFGAPGALACALGNLGGDLYSGFDIYCIFGFFGNFCMAWLPYKLWHTLFINHTKPLHYLDSPGSVLKFALISMISSCASVGIIAAGGQLLNGFSFGKFFISVGLQYYDFSILGGMLLFHICISVFRISPHIPQVVYGRSYKKGAYLPDYILTIFVVVLSLSLAAFTLLPQAINILSELAMSVLCILLLVSCAALALLPMGRGEKDENAAEEKQYTAVEGMKAQCIIGFMVMLCCLLCFSIFTSYRLLYNDYLLYGSDIGGFSIIYVRVAISVAIAASALIVFLSLILRLISMKVVEPVELVATYTRKFVEDGELHIKPLLINRTGNELDDLAKSVNIMAEDIRNYMEDIRIRTIKEQKMAAELSIARTIQQSLLPKPWDGSGFDLEAYIKPAREVGGDFYHFVKLDESRIFICIADVSGKDISAAMFMVKAKTLMEAACDRSPDEMLEYVNDELSKGNNAMMFVTAFAAVADRKQKKLFYANAGHNLPVCRNGGKLEWLDNEADFVLGPTAGTTYQLHTMDIKDDFNLLIYTDGVTEAESLAEGFFGGDRLIKQLENTLKESSYSRDIINDTANALEIFTSGAEQSDDITMLALALKGE